MHLDDHGFEIYEENEYPQAYLLTWRTYGSWLHGDNRSSVGRNGNNLFRGPKIDPNPGLHEHMKELASEPMILDARMRAKVEESIKALCSRRDYFLQAENVRTNHVHAVISAARKPERIVVDLKANATRMLREAGLVSDTERIWSRGMSTKYLWKPRHVSAAVNYVLYCQGDEEFIIND